MTARIWIAVLSLSAAFADRLMTFENKLVTFSQAQQLCLKYGGRLVQERDLNGTALPNKTSTHNDPFQFWIAKPVFVALEANDAYQTQGSLMLAKPGSTMQDDSLTDAHPVLNQPLAQQPANDDSLTDPHTPANLALNVPNSKAEKAPMQGDDSTTDPHDDRLQKAVHKTQPGKKDGDDDDKAPDDKDDDDKSDPPKKGSKDDRRKPKSKSPNSKKDDGSESDQKSKPKPSAADDDDDDDGKADDSGESGEKKKKTKPSSSKRDKEETISKSGSPKHKEDLNDEDDDKRVKSQNSLPRTKIAKPVKKLEVTIRKMSEKERASKKDMVDAVRLEKGIRMEPKMSQPKLPDAKSSRDDFISEKIPPEKTKTDVSGTTMLESGRVQPQKPVQSPASNASAPVSAQPNVMLGASLPASSIPNAIASGMISPSTPLVVKPASDSPSLAGGVPGTPAPAPSAVDSISPDDASFRPAVVKPTGFGFQALSLDDPNQVPDCITSLAGKHFRTFCTELHIPVCVIPSP